MKGKKFLSTIVSAAMCLSLLAGCGANETGQVSQENTAEASDAVADSTEPSTDVPDEEPSQGVMSDDPLDKITQGYYTYAYPVDGIGDFAYYFHFYEEAPVIGSVFYAGFAMNQINFAGTYTVEEQEFEYACFATRDELQAAGEGAEPPQGTAPYTITFFDWEGNELDRCGFDGDELYNDMEVISGVGSGPCYYTHDTEGESSRYFDFYEAEVGIPYLDFVADDPTSTLTLYHNGTYMDLVNMMVEGTWMMEETADGYDYILTPDSDADTPAVLSVTVESAAYTPEGGEAMIMTNAAEAGPKVALTMKGEVPIPGQDTMAELIVLMYDDGSCTAAASAFGQEMPVDDGTYSMGADGYTITFQFSNAGEIVSSMDSETKSVSIQYVQAGTALGDIDTIAEIVME